MLVPIQCEYYALEGLTQLIATINLVRDHLNPDLAIAGVLLTMFDGRTNLSTEVAAEVRRHLHDAVFDTIVPRSVRLSEAPSHGLPIALYRPESKGAEAYRAAGPRGPGTPCRRAGACSRRIRSRRPDDERSVDRHAGGDRRMTVKADRSTAALGRGLASLIPQRSQTTAAVVEVALARITPNPYQPRHRIDDARLEELAASIREHGVLQPVLVTETLDGYQLVAGERRVRAARLAGLERIPALVRQLADRDQLEIALVENVQRADLDPIDEATRLPPAHRRVRAHAGARRRARRQVARRRSPTRCACSTCTRTSRPRSPTGASARDTAGRSAGSRSTARPTCSAP